MDHAPLRLLILAFASIVLAAPAPGQSRLGRRSGPVGKLYVAEMRGEVEITSGQRIHEARQSAAFDAPGTVIETKPDSHNAIVYSNGSGLFVDADTRVEIQRFVQEAFQPSLHSIDTEPSITHSTVFVARGFVGICTSRMVSGSTMVYATPHAEVNIRGRRVGISTGPDETVVYLLEGDVTVRAGERDASGHVLRPGEQAVIRPAGPGRPPTVTIGPIPHGLLRSLDDRVNVACTARRTVSFETIDRSGGDDDRGEQDIVARPTVPAELPPNLVVSPDRLPGTE